MPPALLLYRCTFTTFIYKPLSAVRVVYDHVVLSPFIARQGVDGNYVLEFYKDAKSSESKGAIPLDLVTEVVRVGAIHLFHVIGTLMS